MSKLNLQQSGKNALRKASRQAIADYFVSLPLHERRVKWLRKNNPYRENCVKQYSGEVKPSGSGSVDHEKVERGSPNTI